MARTRVGPVAKQASNNNTTRNDTEVAVYLRGSIAGISTVRCLVSCRRPVAVWGERKGTTPPKVEAALDSSEAEDRSLLPANLGHTQSLALGRNDEPACPACTATLSPSLSGYRGFPASLQFAGTAGGGARATRKARRAIADLSRGQGCGKGRRREPGVRRVFRDKSAALVPDPASAFVLSISWYLLLPFNDEPE